MNTQNTTNTSNPNYPVEFKIGRYLDLFFPGGEYCEELNDLTKSWEGKDYPSPHFKMVQIAALGVICGVRMERKRKKGTL
jgi:hypothetical protein